MVVVFQCDSDPTEFGVDIYGPGVLDYDDGSYTSHEDATEAAEILAKLISKKYNNKTTVVQI